MCGMIMGVLGGVISAMGALQQGKAQEASLKAQAAFNKRQAGAEILKGSSEIALQRRNVQRITGAQTARYGASGILSEEGSPVETALQTETEAAMDRQAIRFGRDLTASNYMYKAKIDEMNAKQAVIASRFGAATALISGFSSISFPTA